MSEQTRPGQDLDPDTDYRISGSLLNQLHEMAVRNFNEAKTDDTGFSCAQAFYNGYGSAIRGIRDLVLSLPDYKYTTHPRHQASDPEVP
jgi:hypothetical protein